MKNLGLSSFKIQQDSKINLCIVIPCYNEEDGIDVQVYRTFLEQSSGLLLCFVDDGSTDQTSAVLEAVARDFERKVVILSMSCHSVHD